MRMMSRYSCLLALLAAGSLSWTIACGPNSDGDADADADGDSDADGDGDNTLEFVSDETQFLQYSESVNLQVRYLDPQGSPIAATQIAWALAGTDTGGSTLMGQYSVTNDSGIAEMRLTSGTTNATFQVQVTSPDGDALAFTVTVSDTSVGSLVVRMTYTGAQTFTLFRPYLWQGVACADIDPANPTDVHTVGATVTRLSDRPRFDSLAPAADYTVGVAAEAGGEVVGWGCVQAVEVVGRQTTETEVTITDIAQTVRFEGVYDLESNVDFGETLPPSVDSALTIFNELTDDNNVDCGGTDYGQDPGAFILDIVARQTCAWECEAGQDYGDCSQLNHPLGDLRLMCDQNFQDWEGAQSRFTGGCAVWELFGSEAQDLINDQIADWVPAFLENFVFIVGDLSRAIQMARISSVLTIEPEGELGAPFTHVLTTMHVRLHDLTGAVTDHDVDLAAAGITSLTAAETAGINGNLLTLHDHQFQFNFGKLLRYIYVNTLLPLLGFTSTADMLASWIDCYSIAETVWGWLDGMGIALVSVDTLNGYCEAGLAAAGPALEDLIEDSVGTDNTLVLAGTATGEDVDADDIAHTLADGVWEGEWTEGVMTGAVTGDFTGTRR